MARKNKITDDPKAEKYQRDRTQKLKDSTSSWARLQKTPPAYLSDAAKRAYRSILPALVKSDVVKQPDLAVVVALSDCTSKIKQLAAELGLTPQSRATLLNLSDGDDDSDPMADIAKIINGGGKA